MHDSLHDRRVLVCQGRLPPRSHLHRRERVWSAVLWSRGRRNQSSLNNVFYVFFRFHSLRWHNYDNGANIMDIVDHRLDQRLSTTTGRPNDNSTKRQLDQSTARPIDNSINRQLDHDNSTKRLPNRATTWPNNTDPLLPRAQQMTLAKMCTNSRYTLCIMKQRTRPTTWHKRQLDQKAQLSVLSCACSASVFKWQFDQSTTKYKCASPSA